jgi:hypothetical protein
MLAVDSDGCRRSDEFVAFAGVRKILGIKKNREGCVWCFVLSPLFVTPLTLDTHTHHDIRLTATHPSRRFYNKRAPPGKGREKRKVRMHEFLRLLDCCYIKICYIKHCIYNILHTLHTLHI